MINGLTRGRIVWYTVQEADLREDQKSHAGNAVVGIVTKVWNTDGCVNLTLFPDEGDGFLDYGSAKPRPMLVVSRTSTLYDPAGTPGTWRWPDREETKPVEIPVESPTLAEPDKAEEATKV